MSHVIEAIKDNPEVFAAAVAFIGIGGGILGNFIGARIQLRGGRAQADAARDAARITAEAQRLAALRDDRRREIAQFIQKTRETVSHAEALYQRDHEGGQQAAVRITYLELSQKQAELELIAPVGLVELARRVVEIVESCMDLADDRSLAERGRRRLEDVPAMSPHHACAQRALRALHEARAANLARDENEYAASRSRARAALEELPHLTDVERFLLLDDTYRFPLRERRRDQEDSLDVALGELVTAARRLLKSEDFD
ncbi:MULTISPECIES: hypothetical protein [unclassified Streptomyces]|uniref:hypothetical protein n=1 Tax=unclassified Streptomyces TaxID=2593676 RepID=UPI0011B93C67|nr:MULTISPECIES: hypothetical protein [unclassified Streptomyces]MYT68352.1 hypothetical protein [Streptomyces sp. SID8367]